MKSSLIRTQTILRNFRKLFKVHSRPAVDLAHIIHGPPLSPGSTPFIILHGLLGSKRNWTTVGKTLAEVLNKTVIAADIRNHGESPHQSSHTYPELADDVEQLMNKLNISVADLLGHSMGGRTAMVLALTKPSRVNSLIVVDISPITTAGIFNDFFPRLFDAMRAVKFDGSPNVVEARTKARRALAASGIAESVESLSFVIMNAGKTVDRSLGWTCNVKALKNHFVDISSFPTDFVKDKQFHGRTLFLGGEDSHHLPPGDMTKIRKSFPKAQIHYMKGVGHNPHSEDPATFITVVVDFMNRGNFVK